MSLYRFPVSLTSFLQIKSKKQLQEKLSDQQSLKSSSYNKKIPLKGIQLSQFQGKHIYVKCICTSNGKKCEWKLIYTKKLLKVSQPMKVLQIWQQSQVYYLKLQKSHFYHNHTPFTTLLPSDHPPVQYNCLWTMLSNMGFPAMKNYSYIADFGKQIFIPGNLKLNRTEIDIFRDSLSFSSWAKIAKTKYRTEVLFYPRSNHCQPQIAAIIPTKAIEICAWHGQVIGIKVINTKVVETYKTYEYYKGLIFYQFFPKWKNLPYMFALYAQHNYLYTETDGNINKQTNQSQQKKSQYKHKSRINLNIYKLIKIFIKTMGKRLKTLIIDYDEEILQTIKYTIQKQNIIRQQNQKLNYIIDPSIFYTISMNLNKQLCIKIIHKFMATSSQHQYSKIYKYYIQHHIKKYSSGLSKLVSSFDQNRHYFLPFLQPKPAFVGVWFDASYIANIRLQLQLNNITEITNLTHIFDISTLSLLQQLKTYDNRTQMLQNTYYQLVYPYSFFKQAKNNMIKFAFLLLIKQTLKVAKVNFVLPTYFQSYTGLFNNSLVQQVNQSLVQEGLHLQNKTFQKSNNLESLHNNNQNSVNFQNSILKDQITNIKPLSNINKTKNQDNLLQIQNSKSPKIITMFPPYLQVQDEGQLYVCRLHQKTQQQLDSSKRNQYICQRVNPIYYKALYKCSCGFRQIKGIPCRHILKICIKYQLPVYPYIESNLKFKDSKIQWKEAKHLLNGTDIPKVGKPKLSHRRSRKKCKPGQQLFQGYYCQCQQNY